MILTANDFLKNYGVWLAVALVVIIAVVILILVLQKGKKKIKKGQASIKNLYMANSLYK